MLKWVAGCTPLEHVHVSNAFTGHWFDGFDITDTLWPHFRAVGIRMQVNELHAQGHG